MKQNYTVRLDPEHLKQAKKKSIDLPKLFNDALAKALKKCPVCKK